MGLLVEDLLLLARLDQQRPLEHQPVELLALATDAVADLRALHPERDLRLHHQPGRRAAGGDWVTRAGCARCSATC